MVGRGEVEEGENESRRREERLAVVRDASFSLVGCRSTFLPAQPSPRGWVGLRGPWGASTSRQPP